MSAPATFPSAQAPAMVGHDAPSLRDLRHTAAFVDSLGERQLVFDPAVGASLEVLKFTPELGGSPEFEAALRARVETLHHLQHPSLATIHAVERDRNGALCLISKHTPGRRVSELLPKAHGAAFALELIRLVTPALATLQRAGDNVFHGALSAERIVVTRDGRLVLVEHVLGEAMESLKLSRAKLLEMGFVVPAGEAAEPAAFNCRTDLAQLAFLALALLLGRRLDPADYPSKVPALLDEFALNAGAPMLAARLRTWLERAMQLSSKSFASARDAHAAFSELPDDLDVQVASSSTPLGAFPNETATSTRPVAKAQPPAEDKFNDFANEDHDGRQELGTAVVSARGRRYGLWIGSALAVLAAAEGVALFVLPYTRPAADVIEIRPANVLATSAAAAAALPPAPALTPVPTPAPAVPPAATSAPVAAAVPSTAATSAPVAAGERFGGLTVTSALSLQVFEGGNLLGTTGGPIAIKEGSHNVEFVNDELGFRLPQTVNVKGSQMTTVSIAVPKGRISINAVPWAEVDIDGAPAGQTPIANFALPIGTHEIVFRHPQLGVRKQSVIVKVEGLTRVTQTLSPGGQQ